MAPAQILDKAAIDTLLDALLSRVPSSLVYATDANGLIVPLPESVPIEAHDVFAGLNSVLELLTPANISAVSFAWFRTLETGFGSCAVNLAQQPNASAELELVDARHRFGVFLGFINGSQISTSRGLPKPPLFRKRLCFMDRDPQAKIIAVDAAVREVLGYDPEEIVGQRSLDFVHPDDQAASVANWMTMLGAAGSHARTVLRYRHRDDSWRWFESTLTNKLDDPVNPRVVSELVDITDRMAAQESLRASEQLHRHLTESIPLGILQIDATRTIVYRNARLTTIVGSPRAERFDEQFANVRSANRATLEMSLIAALTAGHTPDFELDVEHKDGSRRCNLGMRALTADNGAINGAIIWVDDITDSARLREELETRATIDALTGCQNRRSVSAALENAIRQAPGMTAGIAVLFIDLDHFKAVNDTLGHEAGDELLRKTANRLRETARTADIVGRLGGDEFLIVATDVATADAALAIAQRFRTAIHVPIAFGATVLEPSASIGVAWTKEPCTADTLVARADEAMYQSKRGRLGPVLYRTE